MASKILVDQEPAISVDISYGFRGSAHAMEGPPGTKVLKDFGGRHVVLLTTFVGFHLTIIYEVGERINVSFSVVFL